jgi:hypothetical protein
MKSFTKFACVIAVAAFAAVQARAAILAQDDFNYPDGDLVTVSGGTWTSFSGTTPLNVASGQAVVTGANSMDDQIMLSGGPHTSDALFASFDVTLSAVGSGGAYFALFKDSGTTFLSKVFATNVAGNVQLGITAQANNPASGALWSPTFAVGTTHKIVVELDQTSGWPATSTLWVDPVNQFSTSIQAADTPFPTNVAIVAFGLRQSNSQQGTQLIDNLIVGTSFADVIPEPSTMLLVGTGLVGMLALRRRRS